MKNHIQFANSLIKFDLDNGPFITGSYMTWTLEKLVGNPTWFPDDLDICCTSENQFQEVKAVLQPLATEIKETNWLGYSGTYWTINDFKYQAFVHPVSIEKRLELVDYTITAIASDGSQYITNKNTFNDIIKKVIILNKNIYEWPIESMLSRYKKYLSRGYTDPGSATLAKLNHLVK
jgi:hypothetical protein